MAEAEAHGPKKSARGVDVDAPRRRPKDKIAALRQVRRDVIVQHDHVVRLPLGKGDRVHGLEARRRAGIEPGDRAGPQRRLQHGIAVGDQQDGKPLGRVQNTPGGIVAGQGVGCPTAALPGRPPDPKDKEKLTAIWPGLGGLPASGASRAGIRDGPHGVDIAVDAELHVARRPAHCRSSPERQRPPPAPAARTTAGRSWP